MKGEYPIPCDPLSYRRRTINSNKINSKGSSSAILSPYYHEDPNDDNDFRDKKFGSRESLFSDRGLGTSAEIPLKVRMHHSSGTMLPQRKTVPVIYYTDR